LIRSRVDLERGAALTDRRLFTFSHRRVVASLDRSEVREATVQEALLGPSIGKAGVWRRLTVSVPARGRDARVKLFLRTPDAYDLLAAFLEPLTVDEVAFVPSPLAGMGEPDFDWRIGLAAG